MTTSADQISALIASNTALKEFFEGERDALKQDRNNLPNLIFDHVYVDTVNGLPGNDGSFAEPFQTLEDAVLHFANGQVGLISLLSDVVWDFRIYNFRRRITLRGRASDNSANQHRTVTFADTGNGSASIAPGAGIDFGGVIFEDCDVVLSNLDLQTFRLFCIEEQWIALNSSSIDGTSGTTFLVDKYSGVAGIGMGSSTFTSMGGRWIRGFAAGVAIDPVSSGVLLSPNVDNT